MFDTDCQVGSKCLKRSGQIYGVCIGGLSPGNANDREPVTNPLDLNGTFGDTCSFDVDCGPGSVCLKGRSIYGTCLPRSRAGTPEPLPAAPPPTAYEQAPYGAWGGLGAGLSTFGERLSQALLAESARKAQERKAHVPRVDPLVEYY